MNLGYEFSHRQHPITIFYTEVVVDSEMTTINKNDNNQFICKWCMLISKSLEDLFLYLHLVLSSSFKSTEFM